jgi:DME family drug/metabolite transporter
MRKIQTFQSSGFWLVTGAAIIWGTIGVATQAIYNLDSTSSLFINLARTVIATPIMLFICWHVVGRQMFDVRRRDLLIMLMSGILLAISHAAYFAAIRYTGVTTTTLLTICISPLVVTCVSVLLKFETLTIRVVGALICALIGAVLLVGLHSPQNADYDVFPGVIFSLAAAVTYASMILCGRFLAADYHPLQVMAFNFSAGTILLLLINLVSGIVVMQTPQGWLLVIYLALVPTALAYWMFQNGLQSVSATAASIVSMLDPLVAALLAWVLFGETLGASGIIGGGLLMLSIFMLSRDKRQ